MAGFVTADGRVLRRQAPALSGSPYQGVSGSVFPPLWSDGSLVGYDPNAPQLTYDEVYESVPAVAAAVNKIANQIATLPLKAYRRLPDGEKQRLPADHPLVRLLTKPVPRYGPVHLKQWVMKPALIHGNALLAKFREDPDGPPTSILPVDWRYVEAYAAQGNSIEWWATTQTGEKRWIAVEDTLHFAWGTSWGEVGVSPLKQLAVTLRLDDAAQRYATSTFKKSATPKLGITLDKELSPAVAREFLDNTKAQLAAEHEGVDNAGKSLVVGGGASFTPLSQTVADVQLIAQRQVSREEIAMIFDLPGPLIGDLTHGTYSNVTELYKQFYKSTLRPWMSLFEHTLQCQLIDPEPEWQDLFVEFDAAEILRGDKTEEIAAAVQAFTNGLMTLNEIRNVLNLPKVEDSAADKPHIPVNNMAPIGDVDPPELPQP